MKNVWYCIFNSLSAKVTDCHPLNGWNPISKMIKPQWHKSWEEIFCNMTIIWLILLPYVNVLLMVLCTILFQSAFVWHFIFGISFHNLFLPFKLSSLHIPTCLIQSSPPSLFPFQMEESGSPRFRKLHFPVGLWINSPRKHFAKLGARWPSAVSVKLVL